MEFASRVRAAVAGSLGDWMEYQHLAQARIVDLLDAQETDVVRDAEGDSSTIQRPDNRVEVMAEDGERVVAEAVIGTEEYRAGGVVRAFRPDGTELYRPKRTEEVEGLLRLLLAAEGGLAE